MQKQNRQTDGCNNRMTAFHSTHFELLFKNQTLDLRKFIVDERFQKSQLNEEKLPKRLMENVNNMKRS